MSSRILNNGKRVSSPREGNPRPLTASPQGSHLESVSGVAGMQPDLQSVLDNSNMPPEAVTVHTVTTLRDHILSLPGACSEDCIARDNGHPGTGRVTLGREGDTSRSCCPPRLSKLCSLVPMLKAIEDLDL